MPWLERKTEIQLARPPSAEYRALRLSLALAERLPMHRNMLLLTALVFISTSVRVERAHAQESVGQASTEKHVFTKDMTIYVSDFDLDAANVKVDSGGAAGGVRPKII